MPTPEQEVMFAKAGAVVFQLSQIVTADFSQIEQLTVSVKLTDGSVLEVSGIDAIELAMLTKPSVLESRRLRWAKFAWFVHNMVGHPGMQLLALVGAYKKAFKLHDGTVPRPLGAKAARKE